jgi:hypothetical protein
MLFAAYPIVRDFRRSHRGTSHTGKRMIFHLSALNHKIDTKMKIDGIIKIYFAFESVSKRTVKLILLREKYRKRRLINIPILMCRTLFFI